jgi:hypothetical protein
MTAELKRQNDRMREALVRAAERFENVAVLVGKDYGDTNAAEFLRASAARCTAVLAGHRFDDPIGGSPEHRWRYECAKCGAVSYHRRDAIERYCARCHEFAEP